MDNGVSAGSNPSTLGRLAFGLSLLAFGATYGLLFVALPLPAIAAFAHRPTAVPRRAAGRGGVTATG